MKNFIFLLASSLIFMSCASISGNGNVRDENRDISAIQTVKTSGSIDVEIKDGNDYSMVVENDENLLPYVVTDVNNGVLNIHYKNGYSIMNDHAKVMVTAPSLDKLVTSGSGDITSNGTIKSNQQLQIATSGSGDVNASVDAPSVKVTGSGSGNISLSGRTKDFDCKISGSGDVKCQNLKSENAVIRVAGSSDVHVFASVSLKVNVTGSGDVTYSGNPASPEIHIAGSGTVKAQN
ncbi:MAG TPA: head GIN domain-containing protein [Hanamia sp.]|nr:head GIN domain-containing protein [Hanamia sp.]